MKEAGQSFEMAHSHVTHRLWFRRGLWVGDTDDVISAAPLLSSLCCLPDIFCDYCDSLVTTALNVLSYNLNSFL